MDNEINLIKKEVEDEKARLFGLYDIDRYDTDYLSDAVVFFDQGGDGAPRGHSTRGHSVHISAPSDRQSTASTKR